MGVRDLTPTELRLVDRETLAQRLRALQAERAELVDDLADAKDRIAELELALDQARGEA